MRNFKVLATIFLLGLFFVNPLYAQEDEFSGEITKGDTSLYDRGGVGTIGTALSKLANFVSLNGFANTGLHYADDELSFTQNEINLLVSATLSKRLSTEFNLEFKDNGQVFEVEYMFTDFQFSRGAILRVGKYLLPTGDYNEYIEVPYIHKLATSPLTVFVSPSEWTDVGIMLRGKLMPEGSAIMPYYSLSVSNGLQELPEDEFEAEEEEEGESIYDNNKGKGLTTQLGIEYGKFFNTSVYYQTSKYDTADMLGYQVYGTSFAYDNNKFSVYAEYHSSIYDELVETGTPNDFITESNTRNGFYILGAYRLKHFEPVARYDYVALGDDDEAGTGMTFGINYYFRRTGIVKLNYSSHKFDEESVNALDASFVLTF